MKELDSKIIFQIKFRPTLTYVGNMFGVATALEGSFEHWEIEGSHKCILFDSKKKQSISIAPDSITFITKAINLIETPVAEMTRIVSLFAEDGQIDKASRIGFRRLSVKSFKGHYKQYVNDYYHRFYGSRDELKLILADSIDDVVTVLETTKNSYRTRTHFGPLRDQAELKKYFGVDKFEDGASYPKLLPKEVGVFVDSEVFMNSEMKFNEAIMRFDEIATLCNNLHKDTWKLLEKKGSK